MRDVSQQEVAKVKYEKGVNIVAVSLTKILGKAKLKEARES